MLCLERNSNFQKLLLNLTEDFFDLRRKCPKVMVRKLLVLGPNSAHEGATSEKKVGPLQVSGFGNHEELLLESEV